MPKKNNEDKSRKKAGRRFPGWVDVPRGLPGPGVREVRRLSVVSGLASNGAGLAAATIRPTGTAGLATTTEWASYISRWTEFRTLALRITALQVSASAATESYGVFATDRSGALAVPTTQAAVLALAAPKFLSSTMVKPFVYEARAIDLEDQLFSPVGTIVNNFAVQVAIVGALSSTLYNLMVEWLVEFKGSQ
jgi:hypothetical protein